MGDLDSSCRKVNRRVPSFVELWALLLSVVAIACTVALLSP